MTPARADRLPLKSRRRNGRRILAESLADSVLTLVTLPPIPAATFDRLQADLRGRLRLHEGGEIDLLGDGDVGLGILDSLEIAGDEPRMDLVH